MRLFHTTQHWSQRNYLHRSRYSAAQGISRLATCVLQSGVELPYSAVKANIGESLNVVIQLDRRAGARFVNEVLDTVRSTTPYAAA